jgi:hypothetical protein
VYVHAWRGEKGLRERARIKEIRRKKGRGGGGGEGRRENRKEVEKERGGEEV